MSNINIYFNSIDPTNSTNSINPTNSIDPTLYRLNKQLHFVKYRIFPSKNNKTKTIICYADYGEYFIISSYLYFTNIFDKKYITNFFKFMRSIKFVISSIKLKLNEKKYIVLLIEKYLYDDCEENKRNNIIENFKAYLNCYNLEMYIPKYNEINIQLNDVKEYFITNISIN